jgi:DNA-binding MarR family transcriptional regulator
MFALLGAAGVIEQRLEAALGSVGLSMAKFGALKHLVQAQTPLSLGDCAARMTCVRSNVTQLMDRLEAEGLVRRVDDPDDRRAVLAIVTPLGAARYAEGAKQLARVEKEFAKLLGGADRRSLATLLGAIQP